MRLRPALPNGLALPGPIIYNLTSVDSPSRRAARAGPGEGGVGCRLRRHAGLAWGSGLSCHDDGGVFAGGADAAGADSHPRSSRPRSRHPRPHRHRAGAARRRRDAVAAGWVPARAICRRSTQPRPLAAARSTRRSASTATARRRAAPTRAPTWCARSSSCTIATAASSGRSCKKGHPAGAPRLHRRRRSSTSHTSSGSASTTRCAAHRSSRPATC